MNWPDFTTATAPWWFVALLAGGLTIVSTTMGALVAAISAAAADKRRNRYELDRGRVQAREQWLVAVRTAAARYIVQSREFAKAAQHGYRHEEGASGGRWVLTGSRPDIRAAYEAYWELVLVADNETGELARTLMHQIRRYEPAADSGDAEQVSDAKWRERRNAVIKARGALAQHLLNLSAQSRSESTTL